MVQRNGEKGVTPTITPRGNFSKKILKAHLFCPSEGVETPSEA